MSSSSLESRAFAPQPSPLLTEVGPGSSSSEALAHQGLRVIIQSPPDEAKASPKIIRGGTGTWSGQPRTDNQARQLQPSRQRYYSNSARRRPMALNEPGGTVSIRSDAPPQQDQPSNIGHRASFGHAMPVDLDYMIDVPNLDDTFNRGVFPLDDIKEASERLAIPPENIMDRSPTPLRQSTRYTNRSGTGRSSRENRRSHGNTAPGRALLRHSGGEIAPAEDTSPPPIAKTFVRPMAPLELLDYPVIFSPRITMNVATMSPLYVGGGCVDGRLNIHIRGTRLDDIRLGRVGIDIIGVEELSFSRKTIFMSIACELIDDDHPPPPAILLATDFDQKTFWKVKPSRSFIPFRLNLPLNVGPGPFQSVRARIRYVIHGTVMIMVNGIKSIIRCCRDIRVISALDPERALLPLDIPLLATEEGALRWGGHDTLKVTAGLHRAVWVSGAVAYVDVNIVNNTRRRVNTIRLKLRRHILAYKNTVALAENKSAGHLRVPNWIERKTLAASEVNVGTRWRGVKGSQLDVMTCEIDIPRNELSVKMGRFFEVKYFVDIAVCTRAARTIRVQLPLTIIHMNSLDIMPNHLPQVAEAFGEKYGTEAGYNTSGRAFAAPREKALIPERNGSFRHKYSYKHSSHDLAPKRYSSSGRNSGILIHGLDDKATTSVERKNSTRRQNRQSDPNQRKRRITLDDPRKLNIDVPGLGPGDPWAAGMGPKQEKEIREEQQKQYRDAERRRSSVVSAIANGPRAARKDSREAGNPMQHGSLI